MTFITSPAIVQKVIQIIYVFILICGIINAFLGLLRKVKVAFAILNALLLVLAFFTLLLFNEEIYSASYEIAVKVVNLPLWVILVFTFCLLVICLAEIFMQISWKKTHLSSMSIKESVDDLATGICFADQTGLPRLINRQMNELCTLATGKPLLNADAFWKSLSAGEVKETASVVRTGERPMLIFKDNKVFSFKRYEHQMGKQKAYEIVAIDVTDKYILSLELKAKNEELAEYNHRMRIYGEKIDEYTAEKEALEAKIQIHDELGKLLLTTTKRLSEKLSLREKQVLVQMWKNDLTAFGLAKENRMHDSFLELLQAAKVIGVNIVYNGIRPANKRTTKVIVTAAIECMTNTVSHAKGDEMYVTVKEQGASVIMTVKNNGLPPSEEIKEGSGFSSLRALVEHEGGKMVIKNLPEFELKITLPTGGIL